MDGQQSNQVQSIQTNNTYPVSFEARYPEKSSRLLALISIPWLAGKLILLIPHLIILYFLGIVAFIAAWIGYWIVLFTGTYPKGMHEFVTGTVRWQVRTTAWLYGLTDKYPPFSLK